MKAQITLTVNESKRLIAKAIIGLPEVKHASEKGNILLKGGTTVSAISEELVGIPLRICGRMTVRGTVSSQALSVKHPHSILIEKGKTKDIDDNIVEVVKKLGRGDIIIISGNALDTQNNVGHDQRLARIQCQRGKDRGATEDQEYGKKDRGFVHR